LAEAATSHGVNASFIELANKVNLGMGEYIAQRIEKSCGSLQGKKVQLIGVAYKPDVSDTRETSAGNVRRALESKGAVVSWHDPLVLSWCGEVSSEMGEADISIILQLHSVLSRERLESSPRYLFDTTGKFANAEQL
jgi:UDP-N-acetyl-D-glucosamine dehydrogenase